MFTPRTYQVDAIKANLEFLLWKSVRNAIVGGSNRKAFSILPTGSGKSVVIAHTVKQLSGKTLILQPSIEILEQNHAKFTGQGLRAGIYSASAGSKYVEPVTFGMIGTVYNNQHLFRDFDYIIIDECHNVGSDAGMYNEFIKATPRAKVLGLTATPYRLNSGAEGSRLEFLNRTNPRVFDDCIYYIQNDVLFEAGHLAPLKYFSFNTIDRTKIQLKANGSDFKTSALHAYLKQADMASAIIKYAKVLEKTCKNCLIFCSSIEEAERVQRNLPGSAIVTGETDDDERRQILSAFTSGKISKLINVGVLTTGFDYPALESILNGRITMSLALYYQIIGRVMRPYTFPDGSKKIGYVVDLGGNIELFGKIETMKIIEDDRGQMAIWQGARQLTNVPFTRN